MKKSIFLFVLLILLGSSSFAQYLDNVTYFNLGWECPIGDYGDYRRYIVDERDGKHSGISFNYGKIYYFDLSPITDELSIGLNVDWANLTSNHFKFEDDKIKYMKESFKGEEIRYSMMIGPAISYTPTRTINLDGYVKLRPTMGMNIVKKESDREGQNYESTDFGVGCQWVIGAKIRIAILSLGMDYTFGNILYPSNDSNIKGLNIHKDRSTLNLNVGFAF